MDAGESNALPEVGQVMQSIPRVDELGRVAFVLVREEAGLDPVDCTTPTARDLEHGRRRVDTDDPTGLGRGRCGEQAGAAA